MGADCEQKEISNTRKHIISEYQTILKKPQNISQMTEQNKYLNFSLFKLLF